MEQLETKNQQVIEDTQTPLGIEDGGCPSLGIGSPREKRGRRKKGGVGSLREAWGYWLNCLEILRKVSLNRYKV